MSTRVDNIDEMIRHLVEIKKEHGNLPLMSEQDVHIIGINCYIEKYNNPTNYGDMIDFLFIS